MGGLIVAGATPVAAQTSVKSSGPSPNPIIDELRGKGLLIPVAGVTADRIRDTFRQKRGETRVHYAVDIIATRGTPVLSTDSGRIIKLYRNEAGGLMVYAADCSERFIYYYAHLDRYETGLKEGMRVARGDTIGFVGTTGNAPKDYPHLHFGIMRSLDIKRWSRGTPVNPAKVF